MDLATITIPPEEAMAKLAEYRGAVASDNGGPEDRALARAYRIARQGRPIIRLSDAIAGGGFFPNGLPRIAVIRADATHCYVFRAWRRSGRVGYLFADQPNPRSFGALVGLHTVSVAVDEPPRDTTDSTSFRGSTVVPLVPPAKRPTRPALGSCHVLWEVEDWSPTPPVDPALLHHIRGDLWAVLAAWDLTELERAVLSQRRPSP